MKFSRRAFLASASAIAICHLPAAEAWFPHGFISSKVGQTVINAGNNNSPLIFANLAKGMVVPSPVSGDAAFPGALTSDGYPNGTLANAIQNGQGLFDPHYYGRYLTWWSGTGTFQLNLPAIIYSGGATVSSLQPGAGASGWVGFNFTIGVAGQPTQAAPVEWAFGTLITAVSTNGGLVQFTSGTNGFSQVNTNNTFQFNNLTGLPAGPNPDGSWSVTKIDAQTITLQGSGAYAGLVSITGAGGPGVQTEAILSANGITWHFLTNPSGGGTYSGFSNLTICKKADQAAVIAGQLASPLYVSTFKAQNPRFIRFMDYLGTQSDTSTNYSYRPLTSHLSWGLTNYRPEYYVGTITNSADTYTCSNPSASGAGAYVDGEIVTGVLSGANTTGNPVLNVNSRGAKNIYNIYGSMLSLIMTGSVPATGTVITFVFTGGGLASPFNYTYTTSTTINGPGGVKDTSFGNIAINIRADIDNNSTTLKNVGINSQNPDIPGAQMTFFYNPNINSSGTPTLGNGLTITGSDSASSGVYTFGYLATGAIPTAKYATFTYSKLLNGWIFGGASSTAIPGAHGGPPLEFYTDLCTRAGVGMWLNIGLMWSDTYVYNAVLQIANAGVKELVIELSNETWNVGLEEWRRFENYGNAVGISIPNNSQLNYAGLRSLQVFQQATAAWTAGGRARSQLFCNICYQFVDMNTTATSQTAVNKFNGSKLNAASGNATLSAFGGPGVTPISTNYSAVGSRPIDFADCVGGAPYWAGGQYNSGNGTSANMITTVPIAAYNNMLVASYNYRYGTPTEQSAALDFCYTGTQTGSGDLYSRGTLNGSVPYNGYCLESLKTGSGVTNFDGYCGVGTALATYDTGRLSLPAGQVGQAKLGWVPYEGSWFMGPVTAGDITQIASTLTGYSGYSAGYTSSLAGATTNSGHLVPSTAADDAANIAALLAAFKLTQRCQDLNTRYITECIAAGVVSSSRVSLATFYGFDGPNYWSIYNGTVNVSTQTTAVAAIQAFDN